MNTKTLVGLLLMCVTLASCSRPEESTQTASQPELPDEIRQAAVERGREIVGETFALLSSNLRDAIQSGGVSNALPFCSVAALPLTRSMAQKHGVTVKRVTLRPRNPGNRANAVESAVLRSFEADLASGSASNAPQAIVTNPVAGQVAFFAPIILSNDLCLQCHGEPGREITSENLKVIQSHYPRDEATGFKLGQLRGAWRIDFPLQALSNQ